MEYARNSALFIVIYWLAFQSAAVLSIGPHVSAFYPTPAVSVGFLAVLGPRYLPVFFVGVLVSTQLDNPFWQHDAFDRWMQFRQFIIYGATGLALNRWFLKGLPIRTIGDVSAFLVASVVATFLSALMARQTFLHYEMFPAEKINEILASFWTGDLAGLVIVGPLAFLIADHLKNSVPKMGLTVSIDQSPGKELLILIGLISSLVLVYLFADISNFDIGVEALCFLPIILGASRLGLVKAYLAALFACILMVVVIKVTGGVTETALRTQIFFIMLTVVAIAVGSERDERMRSEAERIQKHDALNHLLKIAALGNLGVKISHELNQPLATISIHSQILEKQISDPNVERASLHKSARSIIEASNLAKQINANVRDYSQPKRDLQFRASVALELSNAENLLSHDLKVVRVEVKRSIPRDLPEAYVDPVELQQVFIALIRNSVEAIVESGAAEGVIDISAKTNDAGLIEVTVADTGPGVKADLIPLIFDEYQTTKSGGTGMGLPIVSSVVEKSGGSIWYDTDITNGGGFRFTLEQAFDDE